MARDVKAKMAAGAAQLLAQRGLDGTSFAEVLALTGTSRGSIYHHFPDGKDELVGAALDLVSGRTEAALEPARGQSAIAVTELFLGLWRELLDRGRLTAGCAVVAVTVAAGSADLLQQAGAIFRGWRDQLTSLYVDAGAAPESARSFATVLIASTEGAVVLSRAEQSRDPFDTVASALMDQAARLIR
jgi:TetR/AcrR family transcriptional regulator, lmrAB and yxaGH operons repressor